MAVILSVTNPGQQTALAGLVIGLLNGIISTYLRVSPLIATLAMSFIISGVTMLVQQGRLLNLTSDDYDDFKDLAEPVLAAVLGVRLAVALPDAHEG